MDILINLYRIDAEYEDLGVMSENDTELIELVRKVLVKWPNPTLDKKCNEYDEYYCEHGPDSMLFSDLLFSAISWVKVNS